jgi:hypothetical protein
MFVEQAPENGKTVVTSLRQVCKPFGKHQLQAGDEGSVARPGLPVFDTPGRPREA